MTDGLNRTNEERRKGIQPSDRTQFVSEVMNVIVKDELMLELLGDMEQEQMWFSFNWKQPNLPAPRLELRSREDPHPLASRKYRLTSMIYRLKQSTFMPSRSCKFIVFMILTKFVFSVLNYSFYICSVVHYLSSVHLCTRMFHLDQWSFSALHLEVGRTQNLGISLPFGQSLGRENT